MGAEDRQAMTVRPLPRHEDGPYESLAGDLENDPVYLRTPEDWRVYHTRYVATRAFREALIVE